MDTKLAEILGLLATEKRGRGWRVRPELKRLVVAWVRVQRERGVPPAQLSAASGLGIGTLLCWTTEQQGASRATAKPPNKASRLAMRTVAVRQDDDAGATERKSCHRVMLIEGLDTTAMLALTAQWAGRYALAKARNPC